ncbi:MFS transporter [Schaalia suimastitidis]|uniref:MFS transporter n=1 Tax=Schaalia suimastitidis TaxID=121163 RepID=UPI0004230DFD|nr:MFS transporter [Schaalia suimastitidis]
MPPADLQRRLSRARGAVFALFFTNGALFANIIPRYPEIKDIFGLSDPVYGLTVALFPLGAIVSGPLAAVAIRRLSSAVTAVMGTLMIGLSMTIVGAAVMWRQYLGSGDTNGILSTLAYILFVVFFFVAGGWDSLTDVGQNAHGLRVQRLVGRPIINSFHGGWSIGAMTGGLMGSVAVTLGIPLGWHLFGAALIMAAVGLTAKCFALPGKDPERGSLDPLLVAPGTTAGGREVSAIQDDIEELNVRALPLSPWLIVAAMTVLSIGGMLVEDATSTWSALYMRDYLHVTGGLAGTAFVTMLASQAIGRLTADWQMARLGPRRTLEVGAGLIVVGMGLAVTFPSVPLTLVGMACAGFGCAAMVPIAMNAADDVPGLRPGTGLTVVTWLGRLAFLCAPPLVGIIVEATSLRAAMIVIPLAALVAALSAQVIASRVR